LVTVHGTSFSVEVTKSEPAGDLRTRVVVTDGIVTVQHSQGEVLVAAGMEWTSSSDHPSMAAPPPWNGPVRKPGPASRKSRLTHASTTASGLQEPTASDTELANQNGLFAEAMSAREHGDPAAAVRLLDEFIRRYPASPLGQDAHVERFRVLTRMGDHPAAARAARQYLALYGNGFAADEARELAWGNASGSAAQNH
jgi:hypothetical protein